MRVRILATLLVLAFASPALAQKKYPFARTDFSEIELCTVKEMPKPEDLPKGYKIWTQVGRGPLLAEFLTKSAEMIHMVVAVELTPEYLNPKEMELLQALTREERRDLDLGRVAWQLTMARYLFTPKDTVKELAPKEAPLKFRQTMSDSMRPENLIRMVVPCGHVFYGMSFATRFEENREIGVNILADIQYDPFVQAWKQKGAFTEDGKPGAWTWVPKDPVLIEEGHNAGKVVKPGMVEFCGNNYFELDSYRETVHVPAPFLESEPAPERKKPAIVIPPPPPPVTPAPRRVATREKRGGWLCSGPRARWVCSGLLGSAIAALVWPRGSSTALSAPPNDNNTPIKKP